jgi:hypothetical protein
MLRFCAAALAAGLPAADPIAFTAIDGIDFVLRDLTTPQRRQPETMIGGVAVLDFDNDGRPDLYFVSPASQGRLYRNEGAFRFTDVTSRAGVAGRGFLTGAAAADFDNDGFTDLFLAGADSSVLYRNRGDGTFDDVTARAGFVHRGWEIGAGWFDYDQDGWLDLFVVRYVAWDPAKEPPCTAGKSRVYCHPRYYEGLPNALYRNNHDGTFTDVSTSSGIGAHFGKGMSVAFLDFDADGRLDALVANDTVPNFLFRNEGQGRFREAGLTAGIAFNDDGRAPSSMGADARDIDNDGHEDLFITANHNETFPLFRNLGRSLFADITYPSTVGRHTMAYTGWGNGIFDFDNNGWKDLFAARGAIDSNLEEFSHRKAKQTVQVLVNRGGRFGDLQVASRPALHRGAAFGDFDGDGRVDAVVSRIGETPLLLRNTSAPQSHWLGLRLRGRRSNRDGIGAMIHVTGAFGAEQWNRVTTAAGYASSSDRVAHFGMGASERARSVEILWPSGTRQTLRDVACDRYLTVDEP